MGSRISNKRRVYYLLILLIFIFLISFRVGRYPIPLNIVIRAILSKVLPISREWDPRIETIIFQIRLPRILGALLVGGGLAVSGAVYQGMFRNPLVSPDILGVSSGAGFGAALGILFSFNRFNIQLMAFLFGILAVFLVYLISSRLREDKLISLVMTGILISSLFTSLTSLAKYLADSDNKLPTITFWLMGGLSDISLKDLKISSIFILVGLLPLLILSWKLNVLSLNEDEAKTLGLDTGKIRALVVISASLITASAVSISGIIGWIGLLIPHLSRLVVGPNYEVLIPSSFLMGASYLLLIDNLARALTSVEIPLSIMTSLVGVPIFLLLLIRKKSS